MKKVLICFVLILIATAVNAQSIKDHPQRTSYDNASQYPVISAQEHWRVDSGRMVPDNTCALAPDNDLTCAHFHNDLQCPYLGILNAGDVAHCNFSITLHHMPGFVSAYYPGFKSLNPTGDIIWDATGTAVPPVMHGDPNGDVTFTGHWSALLPSVVDQWWFLTSVLYITFDNGLDVGFNHLDVPIWSTQVVDPNVAVNFHIPIIKAGSNMFSTDHLITWGDQIVEYDGLIPIDPINTDFTTAIGFYSYGRTDLIPGTNQIRYDMDLHHEIPGIIKYQDIESDVSGTSWTYSPSDMGNGTHKVAALRVQPDGDKQLTTVLVVNVSVGNVTVETCQDHMANNFGQPLPCTYNPPPVDWHTITGVLQRLNDQIRICDPADNKCIILGTLQ